MHRSVRALCFAACAALAGACGGDDDDDAGAARPGGTAGMAGDGDGAAFALVRGQDTLLVERYTTSGDRVSGVMRDPSGSSVEYETSYAAEGERTMRIVMRPSDPSAGPPIISTFTLRGDSAWLEVTRGDSTTRQGDALGANALPYMSPSMGMMALVAQTARRMVGDSGQVSLLAASVSQNPVLVSPLVFWRADTAYVIGNQTNQFRLVFSNGELVSAENPPQQMRSVRITPGAPTPPATSGAAAPSGATAPPAASPVP